ncbi:hypothetical protein J6590_004421 [Homalodisca vitripennis]|nr:hypothetical protein J6590_004421 [Homalodisca vitripennis]
MSTTIEKEAKTRINIMSRLDGSVPLGYIAQCSLVSDSLNASIVSFLAERRTVTNGTKKQIRTILGQLSTEGITELVGLCRILLDYSECLYFHWVQDQ